MASLWAIASVAVLSCSCTCKEESGDGAIERASPRRATGEGERPGSPEAATERREPEPLETERSVEARPARPNVVVVLIDTLRPDYLGFHGFERETAPFMAELAGRSAVFDNGLSASSWTAPATASLFTSLYPPQHGVVQGFRAHRGIKEKMKREGCAYIPLNRIPEDVRTLPELFEAAGYSTFAVATNVNIGEEMGFDRGFDRFEKHVKMPAEEVARKVGEWRDDIVGGAPFFLYLHLNDVHAPYDIRRPYYRPGRSPEEDAAERYRGEIGYVDEHLRRIWSLPGIADGTVLVLLSDHGEEFWEHGGTGHGPTLYSELHRVLFVFHGPDLGIVPKRVEHNACLIDVLPTLMDLAGAEDGAEREGLSLAPLLTGGAETGALEERLAQRCLFAHRMYSSRRDLAVWAIARGRWKLIDWWGDRGKVFDTRSDRAELHDLRSKRPKMVEQLYARLDAFKERVRRGAGDAGAGERTEVSLDRDLLQRLREIGYLE